MVVELEACRAMPVSRRSVSPTPRKRTAEHHCDRLHGELGIDPDQAGPWTAFAAALLANADRLDVERVQHRWPKRSSTLDASDDLDALDLVFGPREQRVAL